MTFPQSKPHARGWWANTTVERDAIGSNDGLDVGDLVFVLADNTFHRCTSVDGGDSSTWVAAGGAATLAEVLTEGNVTDNQTIAGTNATTSALSALSLIAGTPTNATEIGARALLQGGGGSSGAVVGGIAEVAGGPPPAGQAQQGGLALVHGYDATGVDNQAGDGLVRGGDDAQAFNISAGTLTCRACNTTGDRNGSPAFFRGGNAGNFSARAGGPSRLVGGDAGFNGIGGLAEVVSGGHLSGTGGSTGPVDVHSLDSDGTFIGTGDVDVHTGDADTSGSNKPGNVNVFGGISGLGSGTSAQLNFTAGLQRNNAIPAGDITQRGGAHSGSGRGGHIDMGGGPSTSGDDGDVLVSVGNLITTNIIAANGAVASDASSTAGVVIGDGSGGHHFACFIGSASFGGLHVMDVAATVRGALQYQDSSGDWRFQSQAAAVYFIGNAATRPQTHLGYDIGEEATRFDTVFQGVPAYETEPNLDNETYAVGSQGIIYVLSATGVVNIDLLASVAAHTGKTWHIVVRSAANTINLRRNGGDTINGLGADLTLAAGEYIVHNAGDGDTSVHGPIAVA